MDHLKRFHRVYEGVDHGDGFNDRRERDEEEDEGVDVEFVEEGVVHSAQISIRPDGVERDVAAR